MNDRKQTMAVPTDQLNGPIAEAAASAALVVSANAGKITFWSGLGTLAGGLFSSEVAIGVGIVVSVVGLIFGWRRDRREQREHVLKVAALTSQLPGEHP